MNRTHIKALYIILVSSGLAFIFNFMFFMKEIGISVFIFSSILLGTVFLFGLYRGLYLRKVWWLISAVLFFTLMPGIRTNEFLSFLNICASLGLLFLVARELTGTPIFLMKISDYIVLVVLGPFMMLGRALSTISLLGQLHSGVKHRDMWLRIAKGVIMAIPILVIFGMLFSQADLAFSRFINNFVDINISEQTIQYLVLLFFSFVSALCFLSYIFFPKQDPPLFFDEKINKARIDKGIEVLVFLGLISVLFLVFIGFQIAYLFGGEANIVNAGFTYAEYARRGFFELLAVGILSLLVLLASEKYAGIESRKKQFLVPALVLIIEVMIIIFSALKRLSLYIDTYSLTELRFYVAGFIMLLFVLFILLAVKFIKAKHESFFTFSTLLSVISFLIIVNVINPDAFIAGSNLKQYDKTGKIDALYMVNLSADATAEKIELYRKIEGEDKKTVKDLLQKQKERLQKGNENWQSSNLSRSSALKILREIE